MPPVPEEDNKKSNVEDIADVNDYEPVSNFEVDFKNVCQITKTKPWILKKSPYNNKKFQTSPPPQTQPNDTRKLSNKFPKLDIPSKSSILIKEDEIYDANSFFRRNMDPFANKHDESYKENMPEDKTDLADNGGGSNYYSYLTTPEKAKRDGNTSRQEQRDAGLKSGSLLNNDMMNNYIFNSNNILNNENGANNPNIILNPNGTNNSTNSNNLNGTDDNAPGINVGHFRYTPTINIEVVKIPSNTTTTTTTTYNTAAAAAAAAAAAEEENEKITRVGIRGWKLNLNIMKALTISTNACSTITDITLWNCGLTPELIQEFINIITPESQIKNVTLDQNPLIASDELYSQLISNNSPIKFLSLRSNNITNKGAIALGESLKSNKNLSLLNLWNNKIGKEGAEAIADALKINQTLVGLSLSRNIIKDDGAIAIAKIFSNVLLPREEQLARKKTQIEQEKQKKEPEEDTGTRKGGKGKPPTSHQAKTPLSNKDIRQKDVAQNDQKKKMTKVTKKDDKQKKTPDDKSASNLKDKKAGQDDKNKKGDAKKGAVNSKLANKKGKSDDLKDNSEDNDSFVPNIDHMFEINGQGYVLGNRTLNLLNLSKNELTEKTLNYFYNSLMEQETTLMSIPDDLPGLIRLDLSDNNFMTNHPKLEQINQILNNRNPFIPHEPDASFISNMELRETNYDFMKNNSDFNNSNNDN